MSAFIGPASDLGSRPSLVSGSMHFLPLRLKPHADLRRSLEDAARDDRHSSAFVVSGIGSLSDAVLRFAGRDAETRLAGPFEIIGLSGAITADGAHLHMSIADADGRVVGGHVCYGNEIRTTAEVLLACLPRGTLGRGFDADTGYRELVVNPAAAVSIERRESDAGRVVNDSARTP